VRRRRPTVNLLDQHSARAVDPTSRAFDERTGNRASDFRSIGFGVRQEGDEQAIAAREIRGEGAVDENHRRADRSRRPTSSFAGRNRARRLLSCWPFECRAVGIRRIRGGQDHDLDIVRRVAQRAQQIEGAGHRELRRAQAGDEVASPDASRVLHPFQYGIHDAKSTGHVFRRHRFTRHDAVPREELLRDRRRPFRRVARFRTEGAPFRPAFAAAL